MREDLSDPQIVPNMDDLTCREDMDMDLISSTARCYGLHTCKYCQAVIVDLGVIFGGYGVDDGTIRLAGKTVFEGVAHKCSFFQFCVQRTKTLPGTSDNSWTLQCPTADLADRLTLVVKFGLGVRGGGLNCTITWDRDDIHPSIRTAFLRLRVAQGGWFFYLLPAKRMSIWS